MKYFLPLLTLLFFACGNNNGNTGDSALNKEEDKRKDEIFVIHDEVMPKMGEIHRLGRDLKKQVMSNPQLDQAMKDQVAQVVLQLEKADDGMMSWMAEFQQPSKLRDSKSHEEIMQYLDAEMKKVQQVKTDINSSIEAGKKLLSSLNNRE
jgi:HSP90 family molecular chaperone